MQTNYSHIPERKHLYSTSVSQDGSTFVFRSDSHLLKSVGSSEEIPEAMESEEEEPDMTIDNEVEEEQEEQQQQEEQQEQQEGNDLPVNWFDSEDGPKYPMEPDEFDSSDFSSNEEEKEEKEKIDIHRNDPTKFIIWHKNSSNQISIKTIEFPFSPHSVSVSPHGHKLAVTHFPLENSYTTEIWNLKPKIPSKLCTISHPTFPEHEWCTQVDLHYYLPILWSNSNQFDSSVYHIHYCQDGDSYTPEKFCVWNAYTGQIIGQWNKFDNSSKINSVMCFKCYRSGCHCV